MVQSQSCRARGTILLWILDPACCSCQVLSHSTAGGSCFAVLSCKHILWSCVYFKRRPKWFCSFGGVFGAVCRIGRRSLRNTAQVSLRNATLALLISYSLSASYVQGNGDKLEEDKN